MTGCEPTASVEPMEKKRVLSMVALAVSVLATAAPTAAHRRDLMTPHRAGPIVRNETPMSRMKQWFGPPEWRRGVRIACSRLIEARWDEGVTAYTSRGDARTVQATFIRRRIVESDVHGELAIHTAKGLRVGNREGRLTNLYPSADPMTHAGHTHYRLRTAPEGAYLMAKVVGNRVVRFENWPFEFC